MYGIPLHQGDGICSEDQVSWYQRCQTRKRLGRSVGTYQTGCCYVHCESVMVFGGGRESRRWGEGVEKVGGGEKERERLGGETLKRTHHSRGMPRDRKPSVTYQQLQRE